MPGRPGQLVPDGDQHERPFSMTSCDDGPDFRYRFGVDLFIARIEALAPRG